MDSNSKATLLLMFQQFQSSFHTSTPANMKAMKRSTHCQDGSSHQLPASPQESSRRTEISPQTLKLLRHGRWPPGDVGLIQKWVHHMILRVDALPSRHPGLPRVIESDPALYVAFITTFKEIPVKYKDPLGRHLSAMLRKVQDYIHLLQLFNYILTTVPIFNEPGMVGVPINAILDAHVGTKSGNTAFLYLKVKTVFTKMLNEWARFLGSSDARSVLNDKKDSGSNPHALEAMRHASRRSR